jgi:hypothetical protein
VEVTTGVYASNLIPGNHVTDALGDLQVAMWANPGLTVIGICADAGLGGVLDAALNFRSPQAKSHGIEIKICHLIETRLRSLRSIASWHQYQPNLSE